MRKERIVVVDDKVRTRDVVDDRRRTGDAGTASITILPNMVLV